MLITEFLRFAKSVGQLLGNDERVDVSDRVRNVVRELLCSQFIGGRQVANKDIKEEGAQATTLRHPSSDLAPFRGFSFLHHPLRTAVKIARESLLRLYTTSTAC